MKSLTLTLVITLIGAALASWWLLAPTDDTDMSTEGILPEAGEKPGAKAAAATPITKAASDTKAPPPGDAEKPKTPEPATVVRTAPVLPLADKFVESVTWRDERAEDVLQHLADVAGKGLRIKKSVQGRIDKMRVTLSLGRTAVPKVLDLVLQLHVMSWQVENGVLVIFDNDD